MLSPRIGQTTVRLIRACAGIQRSGRNRLLLRVALALTFVVGAKVALARLGESIELSDFRDLRASSILSGTPKLARLNAIAGLPAAPSLADVSSNNVTSVPAASYEVVPLSPDSIVAAFGQNLATQTVIAYDADINSPGVQLPTQLGGTTVEVNGRRAPLFFVSRTQVNYIIPSETEDGLANIVIRANDGVVSNGTAQIVRSYPAIFTANDSGIGVPAGNILRVKPNGQQIYESVVQLSNVGPGLVTRPIDLGPADEQVYLVLYLSGVRHAPTNSVRVLIGGSEVTPLYVEHPYYAGLDQVNVLVPRDLIGRGIVNVSVSVAGSGTSNRVDIEMAGTGGVSPPQLGGFGNQRALAGQEMVLNGSGFSPFMSENTVKIIGLGADVTNATPNALTIMIPFGVVAGPVRVTTPTGEGVSASDLPVRTSISGTVETTAREPLAEVTVTVFTPTKTISKKTDLEGHFVLPDVDPGLHPVEVDGGSLGIYPPYPKYGLKLNVLSDRDNAITRAISLQQATGASAIVGVENQFSDHASKGTGIERITLNPEPIFLETDDLRLDIEGSTRARFPNNDTIGRIFLTQVQDARTPVELPPGYLISSMAQISPFGVQLDPGATLTFQNQDKLPAGAPAVLFRYDLDTERFVRDSARVTVSADGRTIVTDPGAIKITSYYFAAVSTNIATTVTGRVLEPDRKKPVTGAVVQIKGREAITDGAGSYVIRSVPVKQGELVFVDVNAVRPNGRVDRKRSETVVAVPFGTTKMPDVIMPSKTENRRPTISAPTRLEIEEGKTRDERILVTDPDTNQTVLVKVEGAPFATVIRGGLTAATAYSLRLAPTFAQSGRYNLTLTATDSAGESATHQIDLIVKDVNRAPTANSQTVALDEDMSLAIKLEGSDLDGNRLAYTIVDRPANGQISGNTPNIAYTPNQNFAGADRFTFKVNDGQIDSAIATVTITVRPVNDAPMLNMPAEQTISEGQLLTLAISATDPDAGQNLTFSATGLPAGAIFTQATPTSAQFRWTPGFAQAGPYAITLKVADDASPSLSDTKELRINVTDVSLFEPPTPRTVIEGQLLSFDIAARSGLQSPVTISVTEPPPGASFQNPGVNTLQFRWTPGYTQAGSYLVSVKASIGVQPQVSEIRQMQITVLDSQHDFAEDPADVTVLGASDAPSSSNSRGAGSSVAIGDLDGDGIDDLVIGAPSDGGFGQVHIFLGRFNPKGTIDLSKKAADVTIRGEAGDDHFGSSLAIGDLNSDGKPDLIIGAPTADASRSAPDSGKVYAVFGNLTSGNYEIAKIAMLTILGAARSDHLGASVAIGRIGGPSGAASLLLGAPLADAPGKEAPLADAGAVYGFFGGPSLKGFKDAGSPSTDFVIFGEVANGQFGAALATGRFNLDDAEDIAIAAPTADFSAMKAAGVVYLIPGSASLKGGVSPSEAAALIINGLDSGDAAGSSVAMGDINGDGRADLIIGAPGADGPNNTRPDSGEVHVIFGSQVIEARPLQLTIFGGSEGVDEFPDALGSSVAVGDYTGDGTADLIMGAPGADPVSPMRPPVGAAYMIFGGRTLGSSNIDLLSKTPDLKVFGAKPGARLGNGGFAFGKLDLLGANDLAIGIPEASKDDNSAAGSGEVRVLRGVIR